jgi:4-amino-4-deoxy-L-arabinose transferase-like glycosyltransferase
LNKTSYTIFQNILLRKANAQPLYILAMSRGIMILLLMAVWLLSFYFAQRSFGITPSAIGFLIIALDPFFIALTRTNHLDAPQAAFMFLSVLAFISYIHHGRRWLDLVISGMAGGLAFLAKLPGIFILPTIGLIGLWDFARTRLAKKDGSPFWVDPFFGKLIRSLLAWGLVFLIAYAALWPSMWVQPVRTLERVLNTSTKYSRTIIEDSQIEQEEDTSTTPARTFTDYLRYPETFLWRTTPVVLLGLIWLGFAYFSRKGPPLDETVKKGVQDLLIFLVVYTIGITLPTKNSEKYYAPAYLVLDLLAGLGWYSFVVYLTRGLGALQRKYARFGILAAVILVQSIWVYQSFPYYFTYYNPLLGGLSGAAQVRFIGVGEGLDQAGRYLDQKPGSSDLEVMAWYGIGPLSYFFKGNVTPLYMSNSTWTPEFIHRLGEMDYLVIYANQKYRNQPPELFSLLSSVTPEQTIQIDGAEYAWIYNVRDIPLPESETNK